MASLGDPASARLPNAHWQDFLGSATHWLGQEYASREAQGGSEELAQLVEEYGSRELGDILRDAEQALSELEGIYERVRKGPPPGTPDHVAEVQGHLNPDFLVEAGRWCGAPDVRETNADGTAHDFMANLYLGPDLVTAVGESGYWRTISPEEVKKCRRATQTAGSQGYEDEPHQPRSEREAPRQDAERTWDMVSKKLVETGLVEEVPDYYPRSSSTDPEAAAATLRPSPSFSLRQGDDAIVPGLEHLGPIPHKLRLIIDFRLLNTYLEFSEKIALRGNTVIIEIAEQILSGGRRMPAKATRRQIAEAVERQRQAAVSAAAGDAGGRGSTSNTAAQTGGGSAHQKRFAHAVHLLKRDFKGYYWQFACRRPEFNCFSLWCPRRKKFVYFRSKCLQFGALASVYWPLRISELLSRICWKAKIPLVLYIDDSIAVCPQPIAARLGEILDRIFEMCGLRMSGEKEESHRVAELVAALGLGYRCVANPRKAAPAAESAGSSLPEEVEELLQVEVLEEKVDRIQRQVGRMLQRLDQRKFPTIKELQRLYGRLQSVVLFRRVSTSAVYIEAIGSWTRPDVYFPRKKTNGAALVVALQKVSDFVGAVKPMLLGVAAREQEHLSVTDAALEQGLPTIGGIFKEDGKALHEAFAWGLEVPLASRCFWAAYFPRVRSHIGIWEILAVLVNLVMHSSTVNKSFLWIWIDNLGDVYALARGASKCPVIGAIAAAILELIEQSDADFFARWVTSERNPADAVTRLEKVESLVASTGISVSLDSSELDPFLRAALERVEKHLSIAAEIFVKHDRPSSQQAPQARTADAAAGEGGARGEALASGSARRHSRGGPGDEVPARSRSSRRPGDRTRQNPSGASLRSGGGQHRRGGTGDHHPGGRHQAGAEQAARAAGGLAARPRTRGAACKTTVPRFL